MTCPGVNKYNRLMMKIKTISIYVTVILGTISISSLCGQEKDATTRPASSPVSDSALAPAEKKELKLPELIFGPPPLPEEEEEITDPMEYLQKKVIGRMTEDSYSENEKCPKTG